LLDVPWLRPFGLNIGLQSVDEVWSWHPCVFIWHFYFSQLLALGHFWFGQDLCKQFSLKRGDDLTFGIP
jgi:hypothetical protein